MNWNRVDLLVEDIYGKLNIGFTPIFKETVESFKKMGYKRILDIGCGYGKHSIYLLENSFNVTSIDINEQSIEWLKGYIDKKCITNINLIKSDINDLPFKDNYFDAIICSSVIHHQHLKQIKNSISEIYRVLKQNGCILVDFMSLEDDSFGLGGEIGKNTFIGSREGEEDVPHHYTDVNKLKKLFKNFRDIRIFKNEYNLVIDSKNKIKSRMLDVLAYK